jgi:hypothetical protein
METLDSGLGVALPSEGGIMTETLDISIAWWELALASLALLINVGVSMSFHLDMHAQLVVATVR